MQLEEEKSVRYKSEKEFQGHKHGLKQKKDVYKTLLIGNGLLILIVSFFTAYSQKNVFNEMAKWFPDRWKNICDIALNICEFIIQFTGMIKTKSELSLGYSYLIAVAILLAIIYLICFALKKLHPGIKRSISRIKNQYYKNGLLKAIISIDIIVGSLYVCLFFCEQIKSIIPLNIFSIWLILSTSGCLTCNYPELKRGLNL